MIRKCPHCDLTVKTVSSIVIWSDVIVCGCIFFVQLSETQADNCLDKSRGCSVHYRVFGFLFINIMLALVALYGIRKQKPKLLFPYTSFKILVISTFVSSFIFWRQITEFFDWLPARIDTLFGLALFISFVFQVYTLFIMIWSYRQFVRMLEACRPTKSFKSVMSIWIGDDSRTNMCINNESNDSTCMIETEIR